MCLKERETWQDRELFVFPNTQRFHPMLQSYHGCYLAEVTNITVAKLVKKFPDAAMPSSTAYVNFMHATVQA